MKRGQQIRATAYCISQKNKLERPLTWQTYHGDGHWSKGNGSPYRAENCTYLWDQNIIFLGISLVWDRAWELCKSVKFDGIRNILFSYLHIKLPQNLVNLKRTIFLFHIICGFTGAQLDDFLAVFAQGGRGSLMRQQHDGTWGQDFQDGFFPTSGWKAEMFLSPCHPST